VLTIVAQRGHLLLYVLRVKTQLLFAEEPALDLTFTREPADRPVLSSGTTDSPMIVMDPCVIKDHEGYHLFFSSFCCDTPRGPTIVWQPRLGERLDASQLTTAIAYAFSSDQGRRWSIRHSPIFLPGDSGWDDFRVETASALVRNGILHLFYSADQKQRAGRYQIGEASLRLGAGTLRENLLVQEKQLVRGRSTPVLAGITSASSFRNNVQEPSALVSDDRFEIYFVGLQFSLASKPLDYPGQQLRRVGLGRAFLDGSLEVVEVSQTPLLDLANIIEVQRSTQSMVLFLTLPGEGDAHRGERIGYCTSRDGLTWSRPRTLVQSPPAGFDSWGCMSPTVVQESDQWTLFYTALENVGQPTAHRWGLSIGSGGSLFGTLGRAVCPMPMQPSSIVGDP
jgi:hypothetical protein